MEEPSKTTSEKKDAKSEGSADLFKNMPDWVAPLLSGLASLGGNYMLFIRPLQEKMETLSSQLSDLKDEVKELKMQNKELKKEIEKTHENQSNDLGYLPIRKTGNSNSYAKKRI